MSRQPSPGSTPSQAQQMFHQIPLASGSSKQKAKSHVPGITAGAEDVKYQHKYKELKKKVKEIELDNDRLYLKLLLAKKNIRRMNLERAILYERLAAVPPTPGRQHQELPPEPNPVYAQQQPAHPDAPRQLLPDDRALDEYLRKNPNARVIRGADGGIVAIDDGSGRGALGILEVAPPHPIPAEPGFRREPGPAYDSERRLAPMVPQIHEPQPEAATSNNSSHHTSSVHRSRSSSSRHEMDQYQAEPARLDTFPSSQTAHSRSSSEGQGDVRGRRHDHVDSHAHQHSHVPAANMPPSPQALHSPTHGRLHNHQRVGPGVHLHRNAERDPEEHRQLLRERELEREREREREILLRERLAREAREEEELERRGWPEERASRSDTPGSGPPGEPSRPTSGQSYERDLTRMHAPRVSNLLNDQDSYYDRREDRMPVSSTRGYPHEPEYPRKRARHDIDDRGELRSPLEGPRGGPSADRDYPMSELRGPRRGEDDGEVSRLHNTSSIRDEKMDED